MSLEQLEHLHELLTDANVPYWADSGTLLGLVREGAPLDHDKDIDVSMWHGDASRLHLVLRRLEAEGYTVRPRTYRGMLYSYSLHSSHVEWMDASIALYRVHGTYAWRPGAYTVPNPHRHWSVPFFLKGSWRWPTRASIRWLRGRIDMATLNRMPPWRWVLDMKTWMIPKQYFESITELEGSGIPAPQETEAYLEARYGEWRVPQPDWVWFRDDRTIVDAPPEEVVDLPG